MDSVAHLRCFSGGVIGAYGDDRCVVSAGSDGSRSSNRSSFLDSRSFWSAGEVLVADGSWWAFGWCDSSCICMEKYHRTWLDLEGQIACLN
jgi:hypothetical protein